MLTGVKVNDNKKQPLIPTRNKNNFNELFLLPHDSTRVFDHSNYSIPSCSKYFRYFVISSFSKLSNEIWGIQERNSRNTISYILEEFLFVTIYEYFILTYLCLVLHRPLMSTWWTFFYKIRIEALRFFRQRFMYLWMIFKKSPSGTFVINSDVSSEDAAVNIRFQCTWGSQNEADAHTAINPLPSAIKKLSLPIPHVAWLRAGSN